MTRQTGLSVNCLLRSYILPLNCCLAVFPIMTPILGATEFLFLGNKYITCGFSQFATKLSVMCYALARKVCQLQMLVSTVL